MAKKRTTKKTETYLQVDVIPPACPKCGSTNRDAYSGIRKLDLAGKTRAGEAYTRIVYKRTKCLDCGQARIDRIFENVKKTTRKPASSKQ